MYAECIVLSYYYLIYYHFFQPKIRCIWLFVSMFRNLYENWYIRFFRMSCSIDYAPLLVLYITYDNFKNKCFQITVFRCDVNINPIVDCQHYFSISYDTTLSVYFFQRLSIYVIITVCRSGEKNTIMSHWAYSWHILNMTTTVQFTIIKELFNKYRGINWGIQHCHSWVINYNLR